MSTPPEDHHTSRTPSSRLTIRHDQSVGGGALCPACGAEYTPPVPCSKCGYPRLQRAAGSRRSAGAAAALAATGHYLRVGIRLLILAALAWWLMQPVDGVPRFRALWDRYVAPNHVPDEPAVAVKNCATCQGYGTVQCTECGGRGSVLVTVLDPCKQCGGTGVFQNRMSKQKSPCPFCNKKGKIARQESQLCKTCAGSGRSPCAVCQGQGQLPSGDAARK